MADGYWRTGAYFGQHGPLHGVAVLLTFDVAVSWALPHNAAAGMVTSLQNVDLDQDRGERTGLHLVAAHAGRAADPEHPIRRQNLQRHRGVLLHIAQGDAARVDRHAHGMIVTRRYPAHKRGVRSAVRIDRRQHAELPIVQQARQPRHSPTFWPHHYDDPPYECLVVSG